MHKIDEKAARLLEINGFRFNYLDGWFQIVQKSEPKPRTKTVYKKVEYEKAWEAVKYFEDGGELWTNFSENGYRKIDNAPDVLRYLYKLYKPVEKEINWTDEVVEHLNQYEFRANDDPSEVWVLSRKDSEFEFELTDIEFSKVCHLVASLTDKSE